MLKKRIIPCLDVRDGVVVKGVEFKNHEVVGDIIELAAKYKEEGADEIVFYDIMASTIACSVDRSWVKRLANFLNIPFCVAGGIKTISDAEEVLANGADKISINSPALENPNLIDELAKRFGSQCVVIGIDSRSYQDSYEIFKFTGDESKTQSSGKFLQNWISEVQDRGAGEIVLNCMSSDGKKSGYDIEQIKFAMKYAKIPLVASGGAGAMEHFSKVFKETNCSGALAASVFHKNIISIPALKKFLINQNIPTRL